MTSLRESWKRTEAHLRRAYELAGAPPLDEFHGALDHNELELAADVLADFGDEQEDSVSAFWTSLQSAYEGMELRSMAAHCLYRRIEAEQGYIEARLTLLPPEQGGRRTPLVTGDRPDWHIGTVTESGEKAVNGAPVTVEGAPSIPPAGTGLVRLHPFCPEAWTRVKPGAELPMYKGVVVGHAVVLRVRLKGVR